MTSDTHHRTLWWCKIHGEAFVAAWNAAGTCFRCPRCEWTATHAEPNGDPAFLTEHYLLGSVVWGEFGVYRTLKPATREERGF
jgi:hypothetical protein